MFHCKTRGASNPRGKRRVYFTCHPEEHDTYFPRISEELLDFADCAVWYNDAEQYVEQETDLGAMNLLVLPVTTALLTQPCRAMDTDVPFALAHHIPILPLIQESGLTQIYKKRFGDLHYLNRTVREDTAISYGEKLRRYLESVLIGDDLAARVREAFSGSIFLSYRKKDRKYANQLMRLIHKVGFCRDVAIWYDEFLTPGESFNDAIAEALRACDLFALVVTPNLVAERNYVQDVEYPKAKELKKPILPARMKHTSFLKLFWRFEELPRRVPARRKWALSRALRRGLSQAAISDPKKKDPAHDYLIGLAYLDGIDVETDHKRAVRLISGAAEAGLPEAMQQMVRMYNSGKGLARDYRKAAKWLQLLVKRQEAEYSASRSEADAKLLLPLLWDLGEELLILQDLPQAETVFQRYQALSREHQNSAEPDFQRAFSVSCGMLGELREKQGDRSGAERFLRQAIALQEEAAASGEPEARRDLAVSVCKLGELRRAAGDPDGAEEAYQQALALNRALAQETEAEADRRNVFILLKHLGDLRLSREDPEGAEAYFLEADSLAEPLASEAMDLEACRVLPLSCQRLGNLRLAQGDLAEAERYYQKSFAISQELNERCKTVETRRDLGVCHIKLGDVCSLKGDLYLAKKYYGNALVLLAALASKTRTLQARRDLSVIYIKLADLLQELGDRRQAWQYYELAIKLLRELTREEHSVEDWEHLAVCWIGSAELSYPPDRKRYQKALTIYMVLAQKCPTVPRYAETYKRLEQHISDHC